MIQYVRLSVTALMLSLLVSACEKKDPPAPETGVSTVKVEVANKVGTANLSLNNQWYLNEHSDSFTVSKLMYYLSNVQLVGAAGTYTEVESYHLVSQADAASLVLDLKDVPVGDYTKITFMIGVDSLRNVSGAQTGALDPVNGMFWSWNTGYIMLKLEGNSPKSPLTDGGLVFHAGGYKGQYAVQRTVSITLPAAITVKKGVVNHIHLDADVLKMFKSPTLFDFATLHTIHSEGKDAKNFADNYSGMFTVSYSGL